MKNSNLFYSIVTVVLVLLVSCKKMIEIDPPKNQLVTEVVFADSADATSAVIGMYAAIMQFSTSMNAMSGATTVYTGLASDEIYPTFTDLTIDQFYNNAVTSQNVENAYLWEFSYQLIYQANACIEGLSASASLSPTIQKQLLGEAKFIRCWLYLNLTTLFGDIPLVSTIDYHKNAVMPKTPVAEIYDFLVQDLEEAKSLLQPGYTIDFKLRPNKYAAISLLSRVYLYQKKWEKAETKANEVINTVQYSLETDLNKVFIKSSPETIWQMEPLQKPIGVPETFQFIPFNSSIIPNYAVTDFLLNAFETGDQRKLSWLKSTTTNNQTFVFPFKYKLLISSTAEENYVILRLTEQYLVRAEARAMQNNLSGSLSDLNEIRQRAGLPGTTASTQDEIIEAILKERQVEFFCEGGHRWNDLKRSDKINNTLSLIKSGWQPTDIVFPVPFSELQSNPFLVQSPGY